jgi:hypothetical protein
MILFYLLYLNAVKDIFSLMNLKINKLFNLT